MENLPQTYTAISNRSDFTATEARDYIEGTLNMVYTDPGLTWEDYESDTTSFNLSLSGGLATEPQVENLYASMRDWASEFFYSISEEDKFPYLFDVEISSAGLSSVTVSVELMVGKVHRNPYPFGETDYWSVFEGHCTPMTGGTNNASDRLNDALTDWYTPYGCGVWTHVTNIDVAELEDFGWGQVNGSDPNPGDWIIDYRTFYVECTSSTVCDQLANNGVFCLDPGEMNYYFQSIRSIFNGYADDSGLQLRQSGFGLFSANDELLHYWTGSNKWGNRVDCEDGGSFPYALPQCC